MNLIFLIGMPAAGKSYWGKLWAEKYSFVFLDLDDHISASAHIPVSDIIYGIGEAGFRMLEATALLEAIANFKETRTIIATGGGTASYDHNMDTMLRTGCVVYLRAEISLLQARLGTELKQRPLLAGTEKHTLDSLLTERAPYYEQAHFVYDAATLQTDTFAEIQERCTGLQL